MDLTAGVTKLERIIKAKNALLAKLKDLPDSKTILTTIQEHKKTIKFIKEKLNFNKRFEIEGQEAAPSIKEGDKLEEGVVEGVYAKIQLFKKDGSLGNQFRYKKLED